jgi:two-component system phosphate regulon sensor histidine kinase PhoR
VWTSKLFWKLFFIYTGLSVALTCAFLWIFSGAFNNFAQQLLSSDLEKTGTLFIAQSSDASSDVLATLAAKLKSRDWQRDQSACIFDLQGKPLANLAPSFIFTPAELQRAAEAKSLQLQRTGAGGKTHLVVLMPVREGEITHGVLMLSQALPVSDTNNMLSQGKLWATVFFLLLVSVLAAFVLLHQASRRLTQLTEGAQAIAQRDDPQLIPMESLDELGLLGEAINGMQQKLARRMYELRENSERLETMLGSMLEGVLAVSPEHDVLLANNASCKLLGITIEQPLGRSLMDVTRSLPLHEAVVEAMHSNTPVSKEFESNGFPRRILAVRAMRMPGSPSPGVMVVLHDITDLRRLENLRREFVANVSHELKTPLAAIKAYAETLKLGALNDPEHSIEFVKRIEEQAQRLYELILDLLQLARVESGQEAFEIVDVELSEAVLDCVEQYTELAASKNIQMIPVGPNYSVVVRGDEEGVRTILSNLINNAIKYTPDQGTVTVRWRKEDTFGVVEVEDTGIGIALKDQARVFERFYRVDRARSRELGGTGLGLSIVKQLAQAFGGTVGLESQPKKGSLFWVRLPCQKT